MTMLELLIVLRDRLKNDEMIISGLCLLIYYLSVEEKIISFKEAKELTDYIRANRPKEGEDFYCEKYSGYHWFWPRGEVGVRLDWLNYLIKTEYEKQERIPKGTPPAV